MVGQVLDLYCQEMEAINSYANGRRNMVSEFGGRSIFDGCGS
jgi:hypothetical protein